MVRMGKMNLAASRVLDAKIKTGIQTEEYGRAYDRIFGKKPLKNVQSQFEKAIVLKRGNKKAKPKRANMRPVMFVNQAIKTISLAELKKMYPKQKRAK